MPSIQSELANPLFDLRSDPLSDSAFGDYFSSLERRLLQSEKPQKTKGVEEIAKLVKNFRPVEPDQLTISVPATYNLRDDVTLVNTVGYFIGCYKSHVRTFQVLNDRSKNLDGADELRRSSQDLLKTTTGIMENKAIASHPHLMSCFARIVDTLVLIIN